MNLVQNGIFTASVQLAKSAKWRLPGRAKITRAGCTLVPFNDHIRGISGNFSTTPTLSASLEHTSGQEGRNCEQAATTKTSHSRQRPRGIVETPHKQVGGRHSVPNDCHEDWVRQWTSRQLSQGNQDDISKSRQKGIKDFTWPHPIRSQETGHFWAATHFG